MALVMEIDAGVLSAKFDALLPHLDERQRRLVLAAEARWLGHGGIELVARASGTSRKTGVAELEAGGDPLAGRIRRPGGGRKPLTDADPGLLAALDALVEPASRGDPMCRLRWTVKSTRNLAGELRGQGHAVSHHSVARLLSAELDYSLQGNAKTLEGAQHPDRNAQFEYISARVTAQLAAGEPVISVDAKKKELIGAYASKGRTWRPAGNPERVNSHDFPDKELGKAVPYGVYDIGADSGWVAVGGDGDTAQFAVATIRSWWAAAGRPAYPGATTGTASGTTPSARPQHERRRVGVLFIYRPLAASTSCTSIAGGSVSRLGALAISAAATAPERCASRPELSGKASKIPNVEGP